MSLPDIPCARVLGVPVHVLGVHDVVRVMQDWLQNGAGQRWIAVTSSHGIMEGFKHQEFRQILESAALSVPDGKWTARAAAARLSLEPQQVRGADLMWEFCELANQRGYSSYFFGDTPEVLNRLTARLRGQFPELADCRGVFTPFPAAERTRERRNNPADQRRQAPRALGVSGASETGVLDLRQPAEASRAHRDRRRSRGQIPERERRPGACLD